MLSCDWTGRSPNIYEREPLFDFARRRSCEQNIVTHLDVTEPGCLRFTVWGSLDGGRAGSVSHRAEIVASDIQWRIHAGVALVVVVGQSSGPYLHPECERCNHPEHQACPEVAQDCYLSRRPTALGGL